MEPRILPLPREARRLLLRPSSPGNAAAVQKAIEEFFVGLHVWMVSKHRREG